MHMGDDDLHDWNLASCRRKIKRRKMQPSTPFVHPEPLKNKKKRPTDGMVVEPTAEDKHKQSSVEEVRVICEYGVADKKGQRFQIQRPRTVSTTFGQTSVDGYMAMLVSALSHMMKKINALSSGALDGGPTKGPMKAGKTTPTIPPVDDGDMSLTTGEVVGVISYTEELSKNVVRSGVPPPLPKYTRVAMWRGEDVCLEQLGAGNMKEFLVGITWCGPKGWSHNVDLDLSVMVGCMRELLCSNCFLRFFIVQFSRAGPQYTCFRYVCYHGRDTIYQSNQQFFELSRKDR